METANQTNLSPNHNSTDTAKFVATAATGVDDLIESIITWTHALVGEGEVVRAREVYFADHGKAFFDDAFYDARLSYFFDQFIFEKPALRSGDALQKGTPYELFLESYPKSATSAIALQTYQTLADFRHSVFQIHKAQEAQLTLTDLIKGDRLQINARSGENFCGLEKKAIIQTFVYSFDGLRHLSHGLILHPQRADRCLRHFIKSAKKQPEFSASRILAKLAALHIRHLRHRHVDAKAIYQTGLK